MEDSLFREKAINKISSPEDLSNYLHAWRAKTDRRRFIYYYRFRNRMVILYPEAVLYGKLYWISYWAAFLCPERRTDETGRSKKNKKKNRYDTE